MSETGSLMTASSSGESATNRAAAWELRKCRHQRCLTPAVEEVTRAVPEPIAHKAGGSLPGRSKKPWSEF